MDIDTQDPSVFLLRAFKYLIANQELLTIRKRAKVSPRHAQESGRYINLAPYSYINHKEQGGKMIIKIDPVKQPIIEKIYRDFLSGVPKFLISKEVRELGFPHSGNSAVRRILINPLYAGLVRVSPGVNMPEKLIKGIHEGIVSEAQYYGVQEMLGLSKRRMHTKPKEEFLLNMPKIFQDSSLGQKHAIFSQVFKQGFTFKEGSFRTPSINLEFAHKLLIFKEKWLLFLEQPSGVFEGVPSCGERGSLIYLRLVNIIWFKCCFDNVFFHF
ncbi:hypothetical protein GCM10007422_09610 [Pedobacter zeae]|uniref:Recombinase domain-containing protein n=1 Tax=Pedobacter zeae TaxID=1737356 RepID=A0ABQ1XM78_9SPHI|nr:hypothetical protein GCM10007422_09610 [Pedobacter zeae]